MIKIKKVLSVVGISFLAITLAGCSSNNKSSDSNTLTKTEQQKKAFKEKYDEIKLGDISEKGNGGASITETTELLGKPKSTETTSVNGLKWVKRTKLLFTKPKPSQNPITTVTVPLLFSQTTNLSQKLKLNWISNLKYDQIN